MSPRSSARYHIADTRLPPRSHDQMQPGEAADRAAPRVIAHLAGKLQHEAAAVVLRLDPEIHRGGKQPPVGVGGLDEARHGGVPRASVGQFAFRPFAWRHRRRGAPRAAARAAPRGTGGACRRCSCRHGERGGVEVALANGMARALAWRKETRSANAAALGQAAGGLNEIRCQVEAGDAAAEVPRRNGGPARRCREPTSRTVHAGWRRRSREFFGGGAPAKMKLVGAGQDPRCSEQLDILAGGAEHIQNRHFDPRCAIVVRDFASRCPCRPPRIVVPAILP